jgi:hypothetical protein
MEQMGRTTRYMRQLGLPTPRRAESFSFKGLTITEVAKYVAKHRRSVETLGLEDVPRGCGRRGAHILQAGAPRDPVAGVFGNIHR